jgi:hypothetical protein
MGTVAKKLLLCIATAGLCALAPMSAAPAASAAHHKSAHRLSTRPALDLRLSAGVLAAGERGAFPSAPSLRWGGLGSHQQIELPALGTEGGRTRVPGRVEEFARRVHREGLPVARLWENKSALVSLGLNNKGKPGLWIIQKMR